MAYIQKNNPFPVTGCGRRRSFMTTKNRIKLFDTPLNKKEDFKPHMMYDKEKANTYQEHLDLKEKGYGHTPLAKLRKTTKGKGRHFRKTKEGAGMTAAGVKAYRKQNPGSKLRTAVTGKVKPGSKAAKRRKAFCARSKSWTGERGKAARRRWKC
jgi:hypothetical protein